MKKSGKIQQLADIQFDAGTPVKMTNLNLDKWEL